MGTNVWWIRRDLRLADNQTLEAACKGADRLIALYVLDARLHASPYVGEKRLAYLLAGLRQLKVALKARGNRLIVRHGDPRHVVPELVHDLGARAVFAEQDYSPYSRQRDEAVAAQVPLRLTPGVAVFPPGSVLKPGGGTYVVYSPFKRAWRDLPQPSRPSLLPMPDGLPSPPSVRSEPIPFTPALPAGSVPPPGEQEALKRLRQFAEGRKAAIYNYAEARNRLDMDGTAQIAPYLRFGMLSARQAVVAAREAVEASPSALGARGAQTWLNQLVWREFYIHILAQHPQVLKKAFRQTLRSIEWINDERDFEAWKDGLTGYPVVDAAMRQLRATGLMHNRARMIVASFLVKNLLIDWRRGERWFMQHLLDGDPAANNGGWQWAAGTGTDAVPYFRIFNPVLQGRKHDPRGEFVRRWVPEVRDVPDRYVHSPWDMPAKVQQAAGCRIGVDYPEPIIDHALAHVRALETFGRARARSASG